MSYQALWELEAFGIGNLARIKEQRGEQSKAIIDLFRVQDTVAGDVTRALAHLQSAAARVGQADRALRTAIVTFNGNYEGLRQTHRFGEVLVLVNRPQEAVFALQLLKIAFDEYFTTVSEYNRSQFELFHALGYPRGRSRTSGHRARSILSIRRGQTSCRRWATGRRQPRAKASGRADSRDGGPIPPSRLRARTIRPIFFSFARLRHPIRCISPSPPRFCDIDS